MSSDDPAAQHGATPPAAARRGAGWFLLVLLAAVVLGGLAFTWVIRAQVAPVTTAASDPPRLAEEQKIDALIADLAGLNGVVFIRNNTEHTAADAAAHLRRKRSAAGGDITTARQFIEQVATKSSLSGEPYRIRFSDGRALPVGEYLTKRLAEIEVPRR